MDEWIRWSFALIAGLAVTAAGWLIRLERRLNTKLDREQYERDVKDNHHEAKEDRREIITRLEKRDEYLHELRHEMRNGFSAINLKLASVSKLEDRRNDR